MSDKEGLIKLSAKRAHTSPETAEKVAKNPKVGDIGHITVINVMEGETQSEINKDKVVIDSDEDTENESGSDFETFIHPYIKHAPSEKNADYKTFNEILELIHRDLKEIKTGNSKLRKKVCGLEKTVTDMNANVTFLLKKGETQSKEIIDLRKQNKDLKERLNNIEYHIDSVDQYSRRQNVLFDNIKENAEEDPKQIVIDQCAKVNITINKGDIEVAHRVGRLSTPGKQRTPGKHRPIIARLMSVGMAKTIMENVKKQFKRDDDDDASVGNIQFLSQDPNKVRARVHLTDSRAKLMSKCTEYKRSGHIFAVWIFNFEIYARKTELDKTRYKIESESDLNKIL